VRTQAGLLPSTAATRNDTADTKSRAGRRPVGVPAELVALLRQHKGQQDQERGNARQLWKDGGWVFATRTGRPVNPNTDCREWKTILRDAQVRDGRLGVMGWASTAMAVRYQHVTDPVRQDIARRVGDLIWEAPKPAAEPGRTQRRRIARRRLIKGN
jgi:integrase